MGKIFTMKCNNCSAEFDHWTGSASSGFICVGCGDYDVDECASFFCPSCNKKFQQGTVTFNEQLVTVGLWQ